MRTYATIKDLKNYIDITGFENFAKFALKNALVGLYQACKNCNTELDNDVDNGWIMFESVVDIQCQVATRAIKAKQVDDLISEGDAAYIKSESKSQSAGGYSQSQSITYRDGFNGVFIYDNDLKKLGIYRQVYGRIFI